MAARPWTSPSQDSSLTSKGWPLVNARKTTNVLQLENLQNSQAVLIDSNNNPSKEDLTCEEETSFFAPVDVPQLQDKHSLSRLLGKASEGFSTAMNSSDPYSLCTGKIRPASQELCCDSFPLLKSFQSVSSDVTFGDTNLTLTLSDEQVYQNISVSEKYMVSSQMQQAVDIGLPVQFVSDDPQKNSRKQNSSHAKTSSNQSSTLANRVYDRSICDFINPVYTATTASDSDDSCSVICSPTSKQGVFYPSKLSKRSASFSDIYGRENIPPKYDDMILEDLEGCDITNLFYNIDIASPSMLSASLNHLDRHNKNKPSSSGILKPAQNISCSNHRDSFSQPSSGRKSKRSSSLHNVCSEDVAFENDKEVSTFSKDAEPGRYTKNVTSSHKGKLSATAKYRSKYFSSSKLDSLVATNSIATQTTESQFNLYNNSSSVANTNFHSVQKDQMQQMLSETSFDANIEASHVRSRSTNSSVMSSSLNKTDCHLCLLVIGGQTDSPSFISEPLKLWRCLLL